MASVWGFHIHLKRKKAYNGFKNSLRVVHAMEEPSAEAPHGQQLQQTMRHGRNGQMPAQEQYLGNDKVHLLAAYVYSLSQQPERVAKQ